jgi:hypothetical protein
MPDPPVSAGIVQRLIDYVIAAKAAASDYGDGLR